MKAIIIILTCIIGFIPLIAQKSSENLIASCCNNERGCTGSAYCSACKNCSGCKHCAKNGGSCGVCSSGSTKNYNSSSNSNRRISNSTSNSNLSSIQPFYSSGSSLITTSSTLNLRGGPGTGYAIIEKLSKGVELKYMESFSSWIKVEVKNSGNVGYVYAKYVTLK